MNLKPVVIIDDDDEDLIMLHKTLLELKVEKEIILFDDEALRHKCVPFVFL